ncbi:unnamed protein product [Rotaria sordida]|uniref:TRPM SLOG domain-containing protein n=1 Tax=Rotaria sordida TaxID=392033 RepID=A0A815JK85_9BILA|nr:unnamed protein product [Rotaria sordida]
MRGIIEAATTADGWILTTGLNSGITKLVGEAILQGRILNGRSKDIVSIGFTKWGSLTERTRYLLSEKFKRQRNGINYDANEEDYEFPQEILETTDPETIELHHTYMLLFDDGRLSGYISHEQSHGWILTTGLNSGITKLVGEAILQDRILKSDSKDVVSIGFTKWGTLTKRTRDLLSEKFTRQENCINYCENEDYEFPPEILETTDAYTIELHHTYMLLFDDGQLSGYLGDAQRQIFGVLAPFYVAYRNQQQEEQQEEQQKQSPLNKDEQ